MAAAWRLEGRKDAGGEFTPDAGMSETGYFSSTDQ